MTDIPISFFHDFTGVDDRLRGCILHDFAVHGARHLVLCAPLLRQLQSRPALRAILEAEMKSEGLTFRDAHAPYGKYLDLNSPDGYIRAVMLSHIELNMLISASMGIKTITVHVGNEIAYPEHPLEEQFDWIKRSLEKLLPKAEAAGITICIENGWAQLNTPERLIALQHEFNSPYLGICYDAGHANLMANGKSDPESAPFVQWKNITPAWEEHCLEKVLPFVVNCHLHDNSGFSDDHALPGTGCVNWRQIANLLVQAPRLQVIQSEVAIYRNKSTVKELCDFFNDFPEKFL